MCARWASPCCACGRCRANLSVPFWKLCYEETWWNRMRCAASVVSWLHLQRPWLGVCCLRIVKHCRPALAGWRLVRMCPFGGFLLEILIA